MASKPESAYDSIFNFIFSHKKEKPKKGRPPKPIHIPPVSGLAQGFVEVAMAPWMYPIGQMARDVEGEVDSLAKVTAQPLDGMKVEVGLGSLANLVSNPRKFIDSSYKKYKDGKKWARIGGMTKLMDSTLLALWGKKIGLTTMEAVGVGGSLLAIDRLVLHQKPGQVSASKAAHSASQNLVDHVEHNYGVSRVDMEKIIETSSNIGSRANDDKAGRIDKMRQELKGKGLSNSDADEVAQEFWGKSSDDKDYGVWWTKGGERKMRKKSYDCMLKKLRVEESKALALGTPEGQKKAQALKKYRNWIIQYKSGKGVGGMFNFGRTVGGALHIKNWAQEVSVKRFLPAVIMGDTGSLETILTFGNLTAALGASDSAFKKGFNKGTLYGVEAGTLFKGTDTARGRMVEAVYYLNPYNIAKGMIWDGRTWARLAKLFESGNAKLSGIFTNLARITPKQLLLKLKKHTFGKLWKKLKEKSLGRIKKLIAKAAAKFLGKFFKDVVALSVKEIVKQVLIKIITQVLGNIALPGVGIVVGLALDVVINIAIWIGEKLLKPMLELLVLLVFGGIALILIVLAGDGGPMMYAQRYQNPPITAPAGVGVPAEGYEDWSDISIVPENYNGMCPVAGSTQHCAQGPCGSFTHRRMGTRAVDLSGGFMRSDPGVRAPIGGEIVFARANSTCSDGTQYGGAVIFVDDMGYRWTFYHIRPATTGRVEAGDALGAIQFPPEVQVGRCWTGAHIHIEVQDPSGQYVNSETFLNSMGCNFTCPIGDHCQ